MECDQATVNSNNKFKAKSLTDEIKVVFSPSQIIFHLYVGDKLSDSG